MNELTPKVEVFSKGPGAIWLRIPPQGGIVYVKVETENCRDENCELVLTDYWAN